MSVSPLENPDMEFEGLEEDGRLPSGEMLEDVGTQLEVEEEGGVFEETGGSKIANSGQG